ncbi:hypothetical protein [Streptomyces arenae]|uniref:hypothetical protein n=1 Tax=Streptomyces arenae TaxID=29301 RepID=UPI00265B4ADE|nr:hypothetical protein [Streptomyces arenae]MCG7204435.1 hypothetical protein [Streptomyces arenae]
MSNHPLVVVEAPDDRGLRAVQMRGETVGRVWSRRGLERLMRRVAPRELDLDDPAWVRWLADPSYWPDRRWRRRGTGVLMALGLLASAAALFYVGITDAFNALAYGGRVMGVAFLTGALVEAVAILAVCDYWGKRVLRYSGAAVLVGVGTVTVTNLIFLITQIQGRSYTPFLWLWITLVLWAAWAFWVLTRQKAWQGVPHPKGVALSVVVSGIVGIASLAYSQMYVPYSMPVKIPFRISFGDPTVSADGASLHVPAHIEFRNTGSVRIYVVGTMWAVNGWPAKFTEKGVSDETWKSDAWDYGEGLKHVSYSPSHMLGTGKFGDPGNRLDPGVDLSQDFVVDVPLRSGLGRVEIDATASFIRADRGKLGNSYGDSCAPSWDLESGKHLVDAPPGVASSGDDFYRCYSRIYHSSEMLNLTHAVDYATCWWVFPKWQQGVVDFAQGDTYPRLVPSISRDPEGVERLSDSEQEPYGMSTQFHLADRSLDELLKAAKK